MVTLLISLGSLAVVAAAVYLYLVYPGKPRSIAPFDHIRCAHRGLHDAEAGIPENSLAAFRRAREHGFGVELDIQFTADRQIVVFHDDTLSRMCGVDKRVDELTYAQLQELTLGNTDERIPLLTDVMDVLTDTPIICEIKSQRSLSDTSLCAAALPLLKAYRGPLCMESFNPFMVQWFRKNSPETVRGILSSVYVKSDNVSWCKAIVQTNLLTNCLCRPHFIAYKHSCKHNVSFRVCRHLFRAHTIAWTIVSPQEESAAADSFDGIIFERYIPQTEATDRG